MAEQWLSIVEYARATGISDMTIRRRIRTGRIKADLKEGKYFIPVEVDQSSGEMGRPTSFQHSNQLNQSTNQSTIQSTNQQASQKAGLHKGQSQQVKSQQIMRNHPAAQRPIDRSIPTVRRSDESRHEQTYQVLPNHLGQQDEQWPDHTNARMPQWGSLPESMTRPLIEAGAASIEARALIEFCDRALDHAKNTVNAIEGKYGARLEAMNSQLANKTQEIKALNQQIEDLQLLVQILERKKIG